VVRLVGSAIGEIGGGQRLAAGEEVFNARQPKRFEIGEMTSVLLRRPAAAVAANESVPRDVSQHFFQPHGRAARDERTRSDTVPPGR